MRVTVYQTREQHGRDPSIEIVLLQIENEGGIWRERVASSNLSLLLRGVKIGVEMAGGILEVREMTNSTLNFTGEV